MKRILVVDDAPTVIKLVKFALQDEYDVESAGDGNQALDMIQKSSYDMGIFDINMPGMNGIELTRKVKALPDRADMKIVILSTESSDEMKAQGREAGALGWMVKPFREQDLRDLMGSVFGS